MGGPLKHASCLVAVVVVVVEGLWGRLGLTEFHEPGGQRGNGGGG